MSLLDSLESESSQIIREVFARYQRVGFLFSGGKDATVLLHLIRKSIYPMQPDFDIIHVADSASVLVQAFIEKTVKLQYAPLKTLQALDLISQDRNFAHFPEEKLQVYALRQLLRKQPYEVLLSGGRNEESYDQALLPSFQRVPLKEPDQQDQRETDLNPHRGGVLPSRSQDFFRVHPLSRWTERDIWLYVEREKLPVHPYYFGKEEHRMAMGNGVAPGSYRMRSLREMRKGHWIASKAQKERAIIVENRYLDYQELKVGKYIPRRSHAS